jgi:hydroxypyruvate isomerase
VRFAVNISMLFTELPLLERPAAAAAAGFDAVEVWWPFDSATPPVHAVDAFADAVTEPGVSLAALNLFAGDLGAGDRGVLSHPDRAEEFAACLPIAADLAGGLGCPVLHALYGNRRDDLDVGVQDELAVQMLARAAQIAAAAGTTVVVEAMNPTEQPRFPLHSTDAAVRLVDSLHQAAGVDLGILYDAYHMQRAEGDLIATIRRHAHRFSHVQIADAPDRTPPGTGEIAYPRVLAALEATGYEGFVGLEYRPLGSSEASLAWVDRWRQGAEP